jgi:hypothetical protein
MARALANGARHPGCQRALANGSGPPRSEKALANGGTHKRIGFALANGRPITNGTLATGGRWHEWILDVEKVRKGSVGFWEVALTPLSDFKLLSF